VEKDLDEASVTGEFPVTASDGKNYKANSTKTLEGLFLGCLYPAELIFQRILHGFNINFIRF
jgi:hypothetical protein